MSSADQNSTTRRAMLGNTGKTLSAAGVAMIIGGCSTSAYSATTKETSQDVEILNAAIALEHEGIAAYQIAATSGLLQSAVVDIGITFQGHHKGHRDALVNAVRSLGGTPTEENSLDDYAQSLNAATLKNQEDVLRLALKLERGAANAYLGLIPALSVDFHQIAAQMAGDEAFHTAILANALSEPIPKEALIFG